VTPRLPSLTAKQVLRSLLNAGFFLHHQTGSHATLKRPDQPERRVTVPVHSGDLPRGTVMAIIKQAGMTVEEFLHHL
jgi:predicted RNA binding protein YcfA (HicA-like mRNA interferase family)